MKTTAAVSRSPKAAFSVEEVELPELRPHDVLVRIRGVGICHTDLASRDGLLGAPFPAIFGHEGSGIVERVGGAVTKVAAGDAVVLSPSYDGTCPHCVAGHPMYCDDYGLLNFQTRPDEVAAALADGGRATLKYFGQSSFAHHALADERNAVKVPTDVPLEILGPLGCGIQTGAGTVMNGLKPEPGSSIAILGAGAVGLAAMLAAVLCGCERIVVIDRNDSKLELALSLGATHVVNTRGIPDVGAELRRVAPRGVDFIIDCAGSAPLIDSALTGLGRLGRLALVAVPHAAHSHLQLPWFPTLLQGQSVQGFVEGNSIPDVFIPRLVALYKAGRFPFDKMLKLYAFDAINLAIEDQMAGRTIKAVLEV